MCGISGIINKNHQKVEEAVIQKMNDLIIHRGPDDEGFFFGEGFALAHRRLSIIDLSNHAHQPMSFKDRYTITYNGEIYNYIELKSELIEEGYSFKSESDTEVLLAAYDRWGTDCVKRFNGMWAFAIFDKIQNNIFCSRDRFGIKPFYYTEVDDKFIFGSEIKQLLLFHERRYVNENILLEYLLFGLEDHTNETFFSNIYKLEQAHNLIFDLSSGSYKIERYFDLDLREKHDVANEKSSILELKQKLMDSVDIRLRSDVKVGTCLSGGLDSSSITAIAAAKYNQSSKDKLMAIHAKSIDGETDESYFAKEVAKYCDIDLKIVEPSNSDFFENIDEVIYTQEEPFASPSIFMQYFVMKKAKENNCTVMLDGQGGDETLFGYERYYSFYFASLLNEFKILDYLKNMFTLKNFKVSKSKVFRDSLLVLVRTRLSKIEFLLRNKGLVSIKYDTKRLHDIYKFVTFKGFQKREITKRNLPHLLRYEDKNSMKHSVETRLPFIDYRFVSKAISIQDKFKFKNGYLKYLLRKTVEDMLPREIVWRTNKFGFEAPTNTWLDAYKKTMVQSIEQSELLKQIVNHEVIPYNDKNILWKLYNISVWERVYDVKVWKVKS